MLDKLLAGFILSAAIFLGSAGESAAEWPERSVTLVSYVSETLPWSDQANPLAEILKALVPRLSRELGVPVNLVLKSEGEGVLAANMVAGASPDAYIVGALGPDQTMARVIQGYTPYIWEELSPVATGWREVNALVVRKDFPADTFSDLASLAGSGNSPPRLACSGTGPLDIRAIMAVSAAKAAGFSWSLVRVDRPDPSFLLEEQAEAIVIPLGWLPLYPLGDELKVLTLLIQDHKAPYAEDFPTLAVVDPKALEISLFAFYIPAQVNWKIRNRLSTAINNALKQAAIAEAMEKARLIAYREDLEGTVAVMNREYDKLEDEISSLDIATQERR